MAMPKTRFVLTLLIAALYGFEHTSAYVFPALVPPAAGQPVVLSGAPGGGPWEARGVAIVVDQSGASHSYSQLVCVQLVAAT